MLGINEVKAGKYIVFDSEPYRVLSDEHSKTGRAGAVLRTKLKNLSTGAVLEKTFQGADRLEEADISRNKAQYLYQEGDDYAFMDNSTYEQFSLSKDVLGELTDYLIEGTEVTIISFNGNPINVELPVKIKFKVTQAPPGLKGDTASGGDKVVTLETGLKVTTPLFINEGDEIIVNTEKGEYVSRA
ncbi:MAG: elongation factor P [Candidatus Moranbacteria bacterium]|nr:elongation factor P [Candidatus Moranbacteria bacterium]